MSLILSFLLSVILLPASGIYNAYVSHGMNRDLAPERPGLQTPVLEGAQSVIMENGRQKAVLMLHGFNGSPRDFGSLPEAFQIQGYDVFAPLLPGHGRDPRAMENTTSDEWIKYTSGIYEELRGLYHEVVVLGLSMGAALGLIVSAEYAESPPEKLILLAPFFKVKKQWYYIFPVETYYELLSGSIPYLKSLPDSSAPNSKGPHAPLPYYSYVPTRAAGEAFEIAEMARDAIFHIQVPTLILQSENDRVTDYPTTLKLLKSLDSRHTRLVTLNQSNHVLPLSKDAVLVEKAVMEFIV